jgi:serpin B
LAKTFHFPQDENVLLQDLALIRDQIRQSNRGATEVSLANAAWVGGVATFKPDYVAKLSGNFGAELFHDSFDDPGRSARILNDWAAKETRGHITNIVEPDALRGEVGANYFTHPALVTVNAVYFKSTWKMKFDKSETKARSFFLPGKTTIQVPTMFMESAGLSYAQDDDFQYLSLPYKDDFAMGVLLPKEVKSIAEIVPLLTPERVTELRYESRYSDVDVQLPKFEVRSRLSSLPDVLRKMGTVSAFEKGADFSRMFVPTSSAYNIYINGSAHDAWIKTDEEGTTAAAVTTTMHFSIGCAASPHPKRVRFVADHPFVFFIIDWKSRTILFSGWYAGR